MEQTQHEDLSEDESRDGSECDDNQPQPRHQEPATIAVEPRAESAQAAPPYYTSGPQQLPPIVYYNDLVQIYSGSPQLFGIHTTAADTNAQAGQTHEATTGKTNLFNAVNNQSAVCLPNGIFEIVTENQGHQNQNQYFSQQPYDLSYCDRNQMQGPAAPIYYNRSNANYAYPMKTCANNTRARVSEKYRAVHNRIERNRRSRIKHCCDILRGLVPGIEAKTDKATVLEHTVKFVDHIVRIHPPVECLGVDSDQC